MYSGCLYLFLGMRGIFDSLSGVQRELSWLLSVVKDTESDMREGEEQLLLFWLLLATVSSSKESASFPSSTSPDTKKHYMHMWVLLHSLFSETITHVNGRIINWYYGKCFTFFVLAEGHYFGLVNGDFNEWRSHFSYLHFLLIRWQLLWVLTTQPHHIKCLNSIYTPIFILLL